MAKSIVRGIPMFLTALLLTAFLPQPSVTGSLIESPAIVWAQDAPKPDVDVKIDADIDRNGTTWIINPTYLLIGGAGLVLLIALIAFGSRGGGTTIVREK